MRRFKRISLAAAALVLAFAAGSFDFEYGDLRYSVNGRTLRHWDWVPSSIVFKPACAFPRSGGFPCGSGVTPGGGGGGTATSYTLTGPASGSFAAASGNFTLAANGSTSAVVTPADASHNGIFTPPTVTLSGTNPVTFTYTPLRTGTLTLSSTNGGSLSNPASVSYSVSNIDSADYPGLSGWAGAGGGSLALGVAGDPFGGSNAASYTEDTSTGFHTLSQINLPVTANANLVVSVMVKRGSGSRDLFMNLSSTDFSSGLQARFDPGACTFLQNVSYGPAVLNSTKASTTNLGAGWCLVQLFGSLGNFTSADYQLFIDNGAGNSYGGDGSSSLLYYGPVIE